MATWTDIPDEVLEPGKPIRSVDALALRDNAHPFEQLFTASGTFVSPKTGPVIVDIIGGGGNGGNAGSGVTQGGGGGRSGRWVSAVVTLTRGSSYAVVVGAAGGTSSFAGISAAGGGNGGIGIGYGTGRDGGSGYFGNVLATSGTSNNYGIGGTGYGAGGGGGGSNGGKGGAGAPGCVRIRW